MNEWLVGYLVGTYLVGGVCLWAINACDPDPKKANGIVVGTFWLCSPVLVPLGLVVVALYWIGRLLGGSR